MKINSENCIHALENLLTQERFMNQYAFLTIKDFIESVGKSLPVKTSTPLSSSQISSESEK